MRPMPAPRSLLAALLLLTTLSAPIRAAAVCNVTYSGGPVTSDVQVVQVDWGTGIDASIDSALGGFFSTILDSAYIDWIVEYDTSGLTSGSGQTISRGTFGGRYVITPSTASTTVSDATVAAEVAAQIAAGHLPAPTLDGAGHANTLYLVEFPATITISAPNGGGNSCSAFCAYHSSVPIGGVQIPYAVMPDASNGACAGGCGTGTALENATMVHSHQIVEVITDPDVGTGSIAWYSTDSGCGEIGDICNAQTALVAGYTVQKEWSRVQSACIATAGAAIPICTGTNGPTCRRCVAADDGRAGGCTGGTPRCDTVASSATYGLCVAAPTGTSSGGKGGGCASAGIVDTGPLGILLAAVVLRRRARAAPGPRGSA